MQLHHVRVVDVSHDIYLIQDSLCASFALFDFMLVDRLDRIQLFWVAQAVTLVHLCKTALTQEFGDMELVCDVEQ